MSVATVTATVDTANTPPRVRLDVADTGSPAFATVNVTRLDPDGVTRPVRTADGNPLPMSSGAGLVYDYEVPYGQAVTYSTLETPGNVTTPVTVPITQPWLIHPGVPSRSMQVTFRPGTLQDETLTVRQGVFWPMGRTTPIIVGDGARHRSQSQLVLTTQSSSELAAIRALLADASVLLLNLPPSVGADYQTRYIAVSDVKISRWTDTSINSYRDVTLPFVTVDRPAGGTQSQRTLADLLVYPTLAAVQNAYATFADVLAGP